MQECGKARTVERSRRLGWSGPMASGEALTGRFDAWDERTTGMPGNDAPVGVMDHSDSIHRTAGYVTHTYGGVRGGRP